MRGEKEKLANTCYEVGKKGLEVSRVPSWLGLMMGCVVECLGLPGAGCGGCS